METLKKLFEEYKNVDDCSCNEFLKLYDSMLAELNRLKLEHAIVDLKNMYNHEYAIVNNWSNCNSNDDTVYNRERKKGFKKMKTILKTVLQKSCDN